VSAGILPAAARPRNLPGVSNRSSHRAHCHIHVAQPASMGRAATTIVCVSRQLVAVVCTCRRAGMTTAAVGQNSIAACVPCPAGWFCDPNPLAVAHSPCPVGTQQPLLSQASVASCTLCAAGQFPRQQSTHPKGSRGGRVHGGSSCFQLHSFAPIDPLSAWLRRKICELQRHDKLRRVRHGQIRSGGGSQRV